MLEVKDLENNPLKISKNSDGTFDYIHGNSSNESSDSGLDRDAIITLIEVYGNYSELDEAKVRAFVLG